MRFCLIAPLALMLSPLALAAEETCDRIMEDVSYCSDVRRGGFGISSAIYPDIVLNAVVSQDPLITSKIVVMPQDRTLNSWNEVVDMLVDQIFYRGTTPYDALVDMTASNSRIEDTVTINVEFTVTARDSARGAFVVEAWPQGDAVVIIYTLQEREKKLASGQPGPKVTQVTADLRAGHAKSLESIRFK